MSSYIRVERVPNRNTDEAVHFRAAVVWPAVGVTVVKSRRTVVPYSNCVGCLKLLHYLAEVCKEPLKFLRRIDGSSTKQSRAAADDSRLKENKKGQ